MKFLLRWLKLMETTNTMENIFVKIIPFLSVLTRMHSRFKEQVCNFSTEEAAIREVWMGGKRVLAKEERYLVVKEQTQWFFPLVPFSEFLPRPRRNK